MQELQDGYKLVKRREDICTGGNMVLEAEVMKHTMLLICDLGIKSKSMFGMFVVKLAWDTQAITWKRSVINALHKMSFKTLYLNFVMVDSEGKHVPPQSGRQNCCELEFISLKSKTSR